ncbi:hypothetical protein KC19_4G259900 [Ceratodon purpureus]|uniref:Secreted protein n=1 Tax=Ceratodon purpureus TaxID=3225 RepID=A0A8T0ICR6_CERPU|nr:hypothetical protein KC19_4G259900 [Ceratodon purpureus]
MWPGAAEVALLCRGVLLVMWHVDVAGFVWRGDIIYDSVRCSSGFAGVEWSRLRLLCFSVGDRVNLG